MHGYRAGGSPLEPSRSPSAVVAERFAAVSARAPRRVKAPLGPPPPPHACDGRAGECRRPRIGLMLGISGEGASRRMPSTTGQLPLADADHGHADRGTFRVPAMKTEGIIQPFPDPGHGRRCGFGGCLPHVAPPRVRFCQCRHVRAAGWSRTNRLRVRPSSGRGRPR